jgi:hypothetical protein
MALPEPERGLVISYSFLWPGFDLRKAAGRDSYHYGFLPPRFFQRVMTTALAWQKKHNVNTTPR